MVQFGKRLAEAVQGNHHLGHFVNYKREFKMIEVGVVGGAETLCTPLWCTYTKLKTLVAALLPTLMDRTEEADQGAEAPPDH